MFFSRLPDEWVPLNSVQASKTVKINLLPEKSKAMLSQSLFGSNPGSGPSNPGVGGVIPKPSGASKRKFRLPRPVL